jgi:hypothetical protein
MLKNCFENIFYLLASKHCGLCRGQETLSTFNSQRSNFFLLKNLLSGVDIRLKKLASDIQSRAAFVPAQTSGECSFFRVETKCLLFRDLSECVALVLDAA